jgi:hypothetical protein
LYLVPLWHSECYFDTETSEIIVICEPELPEGISIDDDNNIYVETHINSKTELIDKIMKDDKLDISVGNKTFSIPFSSLYMKKEQYYRIKNSGLSKIKKDIYDIHEKTDIIVKIIIN